jgi:hypothetical protein
MVTDSMRSAGRSEGGLGGSLCLRSPGLCRRKGALRGYQTPALGRTVTVLTALSSRDGTEPKTLPEFILNKS